MSMVITFFFLVGAIFMMGLIWSSVIASVSGGSRLSHIGATTSVVPSFLHLSSSRGSSATEEHATTTTNTTANHQSQSKFPDQEALRDQEPTGETEEGEPEVSMAHRCVLIAKKIVDNYLAVRWVHKDMHAQQSDDDLAVQTLSRVLTRHYDQKWDVERVFEADRHFSQNDDQDRKPQYLLYLHPLVFCWHGVCKREKDESGGFIQVAQVTGQDVSNEDQLVTDQTRKILRAFAGVKELTWFHVEPDFLSEAVVSDFLDTFLSRYKQEEEALRKERGVEVDVSELRKHLSASDILNCPSCGHTHVFSVEGDRDDDHRMFECEGKDCAEELVYTSSTLSSVMAPSLEDKFELEFPDNGKDKEDGGDGDGDGNSGGDRKEPPVKRVSPKSDAARVCRK